MDTYSVGLRGLGITDKNKTKKAKIKKVWAVSLRSLPLLYSPVGKQTRIPMVILN